MVGSWCIAHEDTAADVLERHRCSEDMATWLSTTKRITQANKGVVYRISTVPKIFIYVIVEV